MRLSIDTLFPTALVFICSLRPVSAQANSALTLTTFQPIDGFSAACTKAYNTPLTDCSNSDFSGQGCSAKCIGFLDSLTNLLNSTCVGTNAYPNTLIGLFFIGKGAETLCLNGGVTLSSSNNANGYGPGGGQTGAPATQYVWIEASTLSTSTSTSSTTPSITLAAATSSTTTIAPTTLTPEPTTTSVAVVGVTVTPESPSDASTSVAVVGTTVTPESASDASTSVAVVGTTVTPESPSDASTSTLPTKSSTSSSSTSTSTSNGNGGGTPLDIGSSACRDAAVSAWLFALVTGSAGVIWLL